MDIRDILKSFDQLTEGESTVHKAGPGGYGNKHGSEDVTDQYGKPIGRRNLAKMDDKPPVKRGKGRPPKAADSSGEVKKYDSSALSKAMGVGKAPKPTGKPSVKHSLKEYFSQLDDALNEAGLAVQPMPATPQQKQQQAVATKPSFMIKDPANPNMPAITTQDPAVVQAAKNGTMTMQKPGAAPTAPGATPAAGAGSQVKPMEEGGDVGKHNNATTGFDALVRKLTPKYGKESAMKIAGAQLKKIKETDMEEGWKGAAIGAALGGAIGGPVGAVTGGAAGHYVGNEWKDMWKGKQKSAAPAQNSGQPAKKGPVIHDFRNKEVAEAEAPQHFAQSSPLSTANRGVLEGKKGVNPFAKKDDKTAKKDDKAEKIGKKVTKDIEKVEEGSKPDFLDLDKDGDKKEPMKKAAKDKKKVKEGMEHHLQAARLEGKSHALRKMPYNCTHDDMEEARHYHEGFKEGLDECYGQMPILGRTAVDEVSPEVGTMASYGAHDEMDEGNAFTAGLAKTPHGGKFKVGGQTFTDRTRYDSNLDEFAFESLDKQLSSLLESEEKVSEGMTVSISKGQQGSPDSVSVSAQDGEADQLLSIIKSAGMGLFGGEEKGFNAPQGSAGAHGGISVVDDHDGMMALMKKLSGGGDMPSGGDYESEEGHEGHEHGEEGHSHEGEEDSCNECGYMESQCQCDHDNEQVVDEVESEDQMAYEVAEDNPPDSGAAETAADDASEAGEDAALAKADAGQDEEEGEVYSKPVSEDGDDEAEAETEVDDEENVEESIYESYANSADDTFEADIEFMTNVISGGLNKRKSTGQTTIPVVAGQKNRMGVDGLGSPMKESTDLLKDYLKLSGL